MSERISREYLIQMFEERSGPDGAALVKRMLDAPIWRGHKGFGQEDVVTLLQQVSRYARREMLNGVPGAPTTPEMQARVTGMLDAVDQHALPLLRDQVKGR